MAAIGQQRAQQLVADAERVGLTADQLADRVRTRDLANCSGADEQRIREMITETAHRNELVARIVHLAGLAGRDQDKVAANAPKLPTWQLEKVATDAETHLRRQGIDTRTDDEKHADTQAAAGRAATPATRWQVDRIVKLLVRRVRNGDGGGFVSTRGLFRDGNVDGDAVARLTTEQAQQLIDSLTDSY